MGVAEGKDTQGWCCLGLEDLQLFTGKATWDLTAAVGGRMLSERPACRPRRRRYIATCFLLLSFRGLCSSAEESVVLHSSWSRIATCGASTHFCLEFFMVCYLWWQVFGFLSRTSEEWAPGGETALLWSRSFALYVRGGLWTSERRF